MPSQVQLLGASQEDVDAVTAAAQDYIEGFTDADGERHGRAYHPECKKRRFATAEDGTQQLLDISPSTMVQYATAGPPIPDCEYEIIIDAIHEEMATVRVYSCRWVDFLHIVKARGDWKLLHVTWHPKEPA